MYAMPELPDVTIYVEALRPRVVGRVLSSVVVRGPSLLRTFAPPLEAVEGRRVVGVQRLAKRVVLALEDDLFLVLHLMIAGRLLWIDGRRIPKRKIDHAAFVFAPVVAEDGAAMVASGDSTLLLTEAGTRKRAALQLVRGRSSLAGLHPGGLEPMDCTDEEFAAALARENRTLKRALTDQRILMGIGNAYSDEILFDARLSPVKLTRALNPHEVERLHLAMRDGLTRWTELLRQKFGIPPPERRLDLDGTRRPEGIGRFPGQGDVTAFRPEFLVHGKYGQPCFHCGTTIQRIVRGHHETNYCPTCQNEGRILADRSLSRLLKGDWPRTVEELEG